MFRRRPSAHQLALAHTNKLNNHADIHLNICMNLNNYFALLHPLQLKIKLTNLILC